MSQRKKPKSLAAGETPANVVHAACAAAALIVRQGAIAHAAAGSGRPIARTGSPIG